MKKWKDVPFNERIDIRFLLSCVGASDTKWLTRRALRLSDKLDGACQAAHPWQKTKKYGPCVNPKYKNYDFCYAHKALQPRGVIRRLLHL
jgi:hypothetical protein